MRHALARYSGRRLPSANRIAGSDHTNSQSCLERFYSSTGTLPYADLATWLVCFEGSPQLRPPKSKMKTWWDGQAKSSRYQIFTLRIRYASGVLVRRCSAYDGLTQRAARCLWTRSMTVR